MDSPAGPLEWLETSRFGSFAFGCVDRRLRRKYHSLLTVREPGRGEPWSVLADLRERLTVSSGSALERVLLCDPLGGEGAGGELIGFALTPACLHRYRALGVCVERELRFDAEDRVTLRYRFLGVRGPCTIELEPLLRCRALHALTFENPFLDGSFTEFASELRMQPYAGMPQIAFRFEGAPVRLVTAGRWLTDVFYAWESARGYEAREHLFSPGHFAFELGTDTELTVSVGLVADTPLPAPRRREAAEPERAPEDASAERPSLRAHLERALAQFAVQSRSGTATLLAGYPWYGPRGRDILIALPGLYLASADFELAAAILDGLLAARVHGLVPHVLAPADQPADSGSADASLWFVRAVQWLAEHAGRDRVERFMPAVCELLEALAEAREPRVRLDAGVGVWIERGPWALTWMDGRVDGWPVSPRAGHAVEVDALAYNAAHFATDWAERRRPAFARAFRYRLRGAEATFARRYWDDVRGYLADAHDGAHPDPALRPNQLFALGLPYRPLPAALGRSAHAAVTRELLVPAGLRTLSPHYAGYRGECGGSPRERELSAHQGSAWPWLLGIYADATAALYGPDALAPRLAPSLSFLARHLAEQGCIGQVSELFAGAPPHAPEGSPAQAVSAAELYRVLHLVDAELRPHPRAPRTRAPANPTNQRFEATA